MHKKRNEGTWGHNDITTDKNKNSGILMGWTTTHTKSLKEKRPHFITKQNKNKLRGP
jgi:hypothetical protein